MNDLLKKALNSQEHLNHIGENILNIKSGAPARRYASRMIHGMLGNLKNWNYDEALNYGELNKVLEVIKYLQDAKS